MNWLQLARSIHDLMHNIELTDQQRIYKIASILESVFWEGKNDGISESKLK